MRTPLFALLALLAGGLIQACARRPRDPLEVTIPTLAGQSGSMLRMEDSRPKVQWQYRLRVASHAKRTVRLRMRLADPVPEGVVFKLVGGERILPGETASPVLILVAPERVGAFRGTVELFSDDLAGWTKRYPFRGTVVARPLEGPYLKARPRGILLKDLRPGEQRRFLTTLVNEGSENVVIRDWVVSDRAHVKLRGLRGGEIIVPGAELQCNGLLLAPKQGGAYRAKVRVLSNAVNLPQGLEIEIAGRVVPDYAAIPARIEHRTDYAVREPVFKLEIRARAGRPSFTVQSVEGHERFFKLVSKGSSSPERMQRITFRLRRDAPADVMTPARFSVHFLLAPGGETVTWPVSLRILPPLHAVPPEINFGIVRFGSPARREFQVVGYGNRRFRIKSAEATGGGFLVGVRHAAGASWTISVRLAQGLPAGQHDATILIETDDPDVPSIRVPARVEVR